MKGVVELTVPIKQSARVLQASGMLSPEEHSNLWRQILIVEDEDSCWLWHGQKNDDGYGYSRLSYGGGSHKHLIHRLMFCLENQVAVSSILGQCVLHTCDVRDCVRPKHLYLGTRADNARDAVLRNRWPKTKIQYHEFPTIRTLYAAGGYTHSSLAIKWGVSKPTITTILNNERLEPIT